MLNKKTIAEDNPQGKFRQNLIDLKQDDKEPYLQYAIRESTLYFLSDLVCEFFLKTENEVPLNIEEKDEIYSFKQDWYFDEYDLDASIQSMIAAIKTIENKLESVKDYSGFGNFILGNLQMLYYDMGDRTHGEETFVVINTTGEPLTATENLKPKLLGNIASEEERKKRSEEWEDREGWFWNNKGKDKTSDNGLEIFYLWYWQTRQLQEKWYNKDEKEKTKDEIIKEEFKKIEEEDKSKELDNVHNCFIALTKLIKKCKDEEVNKILHTIDNTEINLSWFRRRQSLHVVLPLIAYLEKFENPTLFYDFVRRIRKNYFDGKRQRGNFVDWRHIIQIIKLSEKEEDVLHFETKQHEQDFKKIQNVVLNEWYNEDEQRKDVLKKEHKADVELWEDNLDLMGDLTPLWKANEGRENTFENMRGIWENFELLYNCYDEEKSKSNPELSNWVRLYRVLIEENVRIGHINYTSGMEGVWFSWADIADNRYFNYLKLETIISLCSTNNILEEIKNRIIQKLPKADLELSKENFSARKHLKAWLLIKTLYAEKIKGLLSFYKKDVLASYADCNRNRIIQESDFSLANSICGYAVKRGGSGGNYIRYAPIEHWENQNPIVFDTIIGNTINYGEFTNRENVPILQEKIAEIDKTIQELLDEFYDHKELRTEGN
jgi:hypothetical protein